MTLYYALGSPETDLTDDQLQAALQQTFEQLGPRKRVLALPPDYTRYPSQAGKLTCMAHQQLGENLVDIMPTLGTHVAMPEAQLEKMFPGVPHSLIRVHDWRSGVVTIGEVPAEFVRQATDEVWQQAWPAQLNRLIWEGGHDLILSIGQVVPHEVIGMANHNKNLFVGGGGEKGINESHYISAVWGIERTLGRADTPLRRILNQAESLYCKHLPVVYVLTVIGRRSDGSEAIRGLFIGDDTSCFVQAAELAAQVNITTLPERLDRVVVYLDPEKYHSTWLGNKAIYRTRMAIADGGELLIIAPGVGCFGEDAQIDHLIRKFGYRTTPEILRAVEEHEDLQQNLSAAAHLMHGSTEGRFTVRYAAGHLSPEEVTSVGYEAADLDEALARYPVDQLQEGWNEREDGERFYYIGSPASGLWSTAQSLGETV